MSVVAVKVTEDKITIAADSVEICGSSQRKDAIKLRETDGIIIGSCGSSMECDLMFAYIRIPEHRPESPTYEKILEFLSKYVSWAGRQTNGNCGKLQDHQYIFVFDGKVFSTNGYYIAEVLNYHAIGAGWEIANTAMYLGKSAEEAVGAACELSIYCEKPIHVMEVERR